MRVQHHLLKRQPEQASAIGIGRCAREVDIGKEFIVDLSADVVDYRGRLHPPISDKVTP